MAPVAVAAGEVASGLAALEGVAPGILRHGAVASLLVAAGELEQGLLDRLFELHGEDRASATGDRASALCRELAGLLLVSLRSQGTAPLDLGAARAALAALLVLDLPPEISATVPEGYAFYGLYPETYLLAAEALRQNVDAAPASFGVIGIRSIGTSLAAAVAAGADGAAEVASVRPAGHPFARRLAVGPCLARRLLGCSRFAVVDEGPGLSGSSFGAVADWLEDRGVPTGRITFFPAHRNDLGPHASGRHRARWSRARRLTGDLEALFTGGAAAWPIASWVADLTGKAEGPPVDLSAGRWRAELFPDTGSWPAVHGWQERRKLLVPAGGKRWLFKFAGLGRHGEEALARARALATAGFSPPVAGLRHGFLVGLWLDDARPLPLVPDIDRAALVGRAASYLAFRASRLHAPAGRCGAFPSELHRMAAFNAGQALGDEAGAALACWEERLPELDALARPVPTDNRMHAWEWLALPGGDLLKTDGVDHAFANDLVGPQDPAWDVAGAFVELELTIEEREALLDALACRGGPRPAPAQLGFYETAYLAFQLGHWTLAARALRGADPEEADRLERCAERYTGRLRRILGL